ncbi:MAG: phosphatidylserine decarboxylase family protein [Bacteroidota bacterium]|jgi:phosphatidylserine decarboxylase
MKFHKEGYKSLIIVLVFSIVLIFISIFIGNNLLVYLAYALSIFLIIIILQFFRNPNRKVIHDENSVISPADGKVVVIENVFEPEYLKTNCIQISIFMSPTNVHINRNPVSGIVSFFKYHPGKFLVAWHPKSSTENERTTIAIKIATGEEILMRQIAGALARRIVWYCKENDVVKQTDEFGFIKFGSRVDLYLPLNSKINVQLNQIVKGGISELAFLS